jgi:hypothetical protein
MLLFRLSCSYLRSYYCSTISKVKLCYNMDPAFREKMLAEYHRHKEAEWYENLLWGGLYCLIALTVFGIAFLLYFFIKEYRANRHRQQLIFLLKVLFWQIILGVIVYYTLYKVIGITSRFLLMNLTNVINVFLIVPQLTRRFGNF